MRTRRSTFILGVFGSLSVLLAVETTTVQATVVNAALNLYGGASQSSTYPGLGPGFAIDGTGATGYPNITHTNAEATDNWWKLDMDATMRISSVQLFNRTDCCGGRLRDITLDFLDHTGTSVHTSPVLNPNNVLGGGASDYTNGPNSITYSVTDYVRAASVQVIRDATGGGHDGRTLSLGEARIFADNVALGAAVTQSSSHGAGPAGNATDGNLGNFNHTTTSDDSPTMLIDLGGEFTLDSVVMHNRDDCCGQRLADITLELLDDLGNVRFNSGTLNASNILGSPHFIGVDLHDLADGAVSGVFQLRLTRDISSVNGSGNDVMSFGEVQAYGMVTPEPTTFLIWSLLAGLGVGLGWRRRK